EYTHTKELESLHKKLKDQIEHNQLLLTENKEFIADMVHQIRTPLSVIMTNTSLIEMKSESEVSSYITQINSAINMLSNSYEDLSYIISNDTIDYKATDIDLSYFLHERIDFFEVIAQANEKSISTQIQNGINVTINDTELERLIDNNLSNALKHSIDKSDIEVILEKSISGIVLKFHSKGNKIRNVSKLFDKNYTESNGAKRSLGLGLNMVKNICEKNHIQYSVTSKEGSNTFTYIFKV
ncbi:MAG: HAMP domain-containing histidine kinase, partial [Sulfurovum sp.]|nr:HAMP domain-containing histidine kinase [Sulfurovum sp.]NNJ45325.1 HAMP domain-containing histidine kinase [Sulfurovum sp.]